MKSIVVTHVTHTDIVRDSRVLKSIEAVRSIQGSTVNGIGIADGENDCNKGDGVRNVSLKTRDFYRRFPKLTRLVLLAPIFIFLEFSFVFVYQLFKLKPKVVHAHDYLALFPCLVYSLIKRAKLVYDAHELESQKNGSGKYSSRIVYLFEKFAWRYVDSFITVSDAIQEWYLVHYGSKQSEVVLNSPLIDDLSVTDGESFRKIFSISDKKLVAVYVGLFVRGRGIENILKLAASVESIHFVFLGDGYLKEYIEGEAGKHKNISIHSFVEHSRVVGLLKSADIGLCMLENISLSDYYAIPNKLLEYTFSGLYILATDFPEMRKVVNEYKLGKCLPDDIENSSNTLMSIRLEDVLARKNADIKDLYPLTWEAQAEKLKNIYLILFASISH